MEFNEHVAYCNWSRQLTLTLSATEDSSSTNALICPDSRTALFPISKPIIPIRDSFYRGKKKKKKRNETKQNKTKKIVILKNHEPQPFIPSQTLTLSLQFRCFRFFFLHRLNIESGPRQRNTWISISLVISQISILLCFFLVFVWRNPWKNGFDAVDFLMAENRDEGAAAAIESHSLVDYSVLNLNLSVF